MCSTRVGRSGSVSNPAPPSPTLMIYYASCLSYFPNLATTNNNINHQNNNSKINYHQSDDKDYTMYSYPIHTSASMLKDKGRQTLFQCIYQVDEVYLFFLLNLLPTQSEFSFPLEIRSWVCGLLCGDEGYELVASFILFQKTTIKCSNSSLQLHL